MTALGRIFGYLSILANLLLALFLLGLGLIGSMAGGDMTIALLPVEPETTATALIVGGLFALVSVVLALRSGRPSRTLLVLWSLLVSGVLLAAFFRASYRFDGEEHFRMGVWIFLGSLLLLFGSFMRWKITPSRRD